MNLKESVEFFVSEKFDYYDQWILDELIFFSEKSNADLKKLQKIMFKMIHEFVINYKKYKNLMPVSNEVEQVLEYFHTKPYEIGTYRTDFVFDDKQQIKLIEISCRIALNGMFLSSVLNKKARNYLKSELSGFDYIDDYSAIYTKFESYLAEVDSITVLVGDDTRNESKIYQPIFERAGYPVKFINYKDIADNLDKIDSSWIISELSFDEILSLDHKVLKELSSLKIINDFRTVFLVHDKRFFDVLGDKTLQAKVLSQDEIDLFERYYIPTFSYDKGSPNWIDAKSNKNNWIIKHRALGKSQEVYAGILTSVEEWRSLFKSPRVEDLVLQKWIPQKTIKNKLKSLEINDYITGTLLFFDDHYYGFGDFRTSSYPVTNKKDHRKAAGLVIQNTDQLPESLREKSINI